MGCGSSSSLRLHTQLQQETERLKATMQASQDRLARLENRPQPIFLFRHAESIAAVDETLQEDLPDAELPLSPAGVKQAEEAGRLLMQEAKAERFELWVSPFLRCLETAQAMLRGTMLPQSMWPKIRVDVRLRDQDTGVFEERTRTLTIKEEKRRRWEYGAFNYRFESGENGAEVFGRVDSFIGSFVRFYQRRTPAESGKIAVIISHGVVLRLFLMRWLRLSVPWLHVTRNLAHAEWALLQRGALSASGSRQGWTVDRELCEHQYYDGDLRTPSMALAASVYSSDLPGSVNDAAGRSVRSQGWLTEKLKGKPCGSSARLTVENRVAKTKPDLYKVSCCYHSVGINCHTRLPVAAAVCSNSSARSFPYR